MTKSMVDDRDQLTDTVRRNVSTQIAVARPIHRTHRRPLSHKQVSRLGRLVQWAARLRGGGSALPGLVIEKIDPFFLSRVLRTLPEGVVVVTGTNGKTTTTKMVVDLLRASGLTVFTNKTGSNFGRGITASLLDELDQDGVLHADIAVLELDEAHAIQFVEHCPPRYALLLNVMRDQLDRFGEIEHTAWLLQKVALATTGGVVLNRDDALVRRIADELHPAVETRYFGFDSSLRSTFPSDHDLYGTSSSPRSAAPSARSTDVILSALDDQTATFAFGKDRQAPVTLRIDGIHNVLNATAALSLVHLVLGHRADDAVLINALRAVRPAFGRGESIDVDGDPLEIVLVKNPAGFRLALKSYARRRAATMIAINDSYADSRDVSWLWDVDFRSLDGVAVVAGARAYDMALRLKYDGIEVAQVEPSLSKALQQLLGQEGRKRIYCTYTAMRKLRGMLAQEFDVERIE